jgi:DnaJ-class molecular chaperone
MPRKYYERAEDWMVTCPECHGRGTIVRGIQENDAQNALEQED